LGIGVDTTPIGLIWWHDGGGTSTGIETCVARLPNGFVWAAMFNSAPKDDSRFTEELRRILDPAALDAIEWPDIDLFSEYYPTGRPVVASGCAANSASGLIGSIAPGERISIAGTFLGPFQPAIPDPLPETSIPKRLIGTEVLVNGI